jgi:hypothetical protein
VQRRVAKGAIGRQHELLADDVRARAALSLSVAAVRNQPELLISDMEAVCELVIL